MIAASIAFALILTYFMFPAFSAFVDKCIGEAVQWIETRILYFREIIVMMTIVFKLNCGRLDIF